MAETVLIVEDDPTMLRGLKDNFAYSGYVVLTAADGEDGLNYLCKGYKMFFGHVDPSMRFMARELSQGRPAANVMEWVRRQNATREAGRQKEPGRNDPCPCGSGKKYKRCCARAA